MSKRLRCSSVNSSGLFLFFPKKKTRKKGKEEEAAYAVFIYLLTCPLTFSYGFESTQCLLVLVSDFYHHQLS